MAVTNKPDLTQESKVDHTEVIRQPSQEESQHDNPPRTSKGFRMLSKIKIWMFLLAHALGAVIVALCLALAVDGYHAVDKGVSRYATGKLVLRVSDVTTLVSAGLVVIKLLVGTWSTYALWGCSRYLVRTSKKSVTTRQLSFMVRWKLPPWLRTFSLPSGSHCWIIVASVLAILAQAFIAPLLSGAVDWNSASVPSKTRIPVNSTSPTADSDAWYWHTFYGHDHSVNLRRAAAFAGLAWADAQTISSDGESLTGNGCRHIVNNNGLITNSTIADAIIPCIDIHSIKWSTTDPGKDLTDPVKDSKALTIVDDPPSSYFVPGMAMVFDPNHLWDSHQDGHVFPKPIKFSSTKTVSILIKRQSSATPHCQLKDTIFGDFSNVHSYLIDSGGADENCYMIGTVDFTAGVTNSSVSRYISPRVVEDQTPIEDVIFEPSIWVEESLWLLPDLMTLISVMNSTQLPTLSTDDTQQNIDTYVTALIRQAYLAAWAVYHSAFEEVGPTYIATPQEPRLKASVSNARVFGWLAISLLMTLSGVFLLLILETEDLKIPSEDVDEERKEAAKGTSQELFAQLVS